MTSAIDHRVGGDRSAQVLAGSPVTGDNRLRWLKAMESAGLNDALRNTRSFAGGEAKGSGNFDQGGKDSPVAFGVRAACEDVQDGRSMPTSRYASSYATTLQDGPSAGAFCQPEPEQSIGSVTIVPLDATPEESPCASEEQSTMEAVAIKTSDMPDKTWAARNLVVLPGEDGGAEVWIRDAKLSGARMQMLLSDLRRTAADLGGGSLKVFVNGRPVASGCDGQTRGGEQVWR